MVWARGGVAVARCPRSVVTAESLGLVEEFMIWKRVGPAVGELTARQVEAFVILENAAEQEKRNGERRTRDAV